MSPRKSRGAQGLFDVDSPPEFASTQDEIRRAVQRNAIQRGQFFALNLARLGFDQMLDQIETLANDSDSEVWREKAERNSTKSPLGHRKATS